MHIIVSLFTQLFITIKFYNKYTIRIYYRKFFRLHFSMA